MQSVELLASVAEKNGTVLRVALPEEVASVVLQRRDAASGAWLRVLRRPNPPGSLQVLVPLRKALRTEELRVVVGSRRAAPRQVKFQPPGRGSKVTVHKAEAGAKLALQFFDDRQKRWLLLGIGSMPRHGVLRMTVPKPQRQAKLRVVVADPRRPGSAAKDFPAAFRTGQTEFAPRPAASFAVNHSVAMSDQTKSTGAAPGETEETDLWKIEGTKIYFFNQLRGLQVIDTSRPEEPEVSSSLRLPAVGEEMFLAGPGQVVLLARSTSADAAITRVHLVDASAVAARIESTVDLPGWYVESRRIGDRLVVVTQDWQLSGSWRPVATISVLRLAPGVLRREAQQSLDLQASVVGLGADYFWVAGSGRDSWEQRELLLYPLSGLGGLSGRRQLQLGGAVYDKFKVHQKGDALFAVTQRWTHSWQSVISLESYDLAAPDGPRLSKNLELVRDESLHATRFDGDRAYVVTFEQVDPLWVIDLAEPADPQIVAELEVPGWSTYLEPLGGYLAAVGVEEGRVTASLFDVRDASKPTLASRVTVGGQYAWSEALWSEKAVAILREQGLMLLPFQSYRAGALSAGVQLLDVDLKNGKLRKRGIVAHEFSPRRAGALREGLLASLSNRELHLFRVDDRDNPALVASSRLAFTADHLLGASGAWLVHAEAGRWETADATLRVSRQEDPDDVVAELVLPGREILAAGLQGSTAVLLCRDNTSSGRGSLAVFDLSKLPQLASPIEVGFDLPNVWNLSAQIVWPSPGLAVAVLKTDWSRWWWYGAPRPLMSKSVVATTGSPASRMLAFQVANRPALLSERDFAGPEAEEFSTAFAADGLVAISVGRPVVTSPGDQGAVARSTVIRPGFFWPGSQAVSTSLEVVDYADARSPQLWPAISLPGPLKHLASWRRSGGLVYCEGDDDRSNPSVEALFWEGPVAHALASLPTSRGLMAFGGRSVWVGQPDNFIEEFGLGDNGGFLSLRRVALPWSPRALRLAGQWLFAQGPERIAAVAPDALTATKVWDVPALGWWTESFGELHPQGTEGWALPVGRYGVEVLRVVPSNSYLVY